MTSGGILVREKKEQGGGLVPVIEGEDHVPERLVREMRSLSSGRGSICNYCPA